MSFIRNLKGGIQSVIKEQHQKWPSKSKIFLEIKKYDNKIMFKNGLNHIPQTVEDNNELEESCE